ncbi:hypothetical protein K6V92_24250 [Cupriavidus respiraculi]|uniref:hypothetical protein n=1 Tax=Cupriavidus respiraculi TaxID=195930 RepID=UPI001C973555|nr:hypothetical protein [Cupriavidus respiraculi]MBY4949723.1 hypothetical protein [Cupriavidus respiraculi]
MSAAMPAAASAAMSIHSLSTWMLAQEARGLLTRLERVKPFALDEAMVPAAGLTPAALLGVERYLFKGRRELRARMLAYLAWLHSPEGRRASPEQAQHRLTFLRLRFNMVLSQFDLFADVITQRSQAEVGVWLAGLDEVAADALRLPDYFASPPVVCYLDRGAGAAIRRARTRLPGGGENPVAIIRVPRERMVGSGIASSLIHEVGHQGVALLDLIASLRPVLKGMAVDAGEHGVAWQLWERWISEILADFWSVARVGIASTVGLIAVVSLPRVFVFRTGAEDPHPIPWVRVQLSCAMGNALYPHPQWGRLAAVWEALYPLDGLDEDKRRLLSLLRATMPGFIALLVNHRPPALRGKSLAQVMATDQRQPSRLNAYWRAWRRAPEQMRRAPPSLAFAVIGQAKAHALITPEQESRLLSRLLTQWALRSTFASARACIVQPALPLAVVRSAPSV